MILNTKVSRFLVLINIIPNSTRPGLELGQEVVNNKQRSPQLQTFYRPIVWPGF